jgi:hypothetical protein
MSFSNNSNPNIKTSICKYAFIGCKQSQKCWYAHNKEELRQRYCINGVNCYDKNCCFLHPNKNVDKDEYYLKILLKSDVLGIDKNNVKKQLDKINDKLIIEINDEDNEDGDKNNEDKEDDISLICDNLVKCDINNDNKENMENKDDNELKNYIENFSQEWASKPQQFYNTISNNNEIVLKIEANDLQFQMISHFMKSMNIKFNIESFNKNSQISS